MSKSVEFWDDIKRQFYDGIKVKNIDQVERGEIALNTVYKKIKEQKWTSNKHLEKVEKQKKIDLMQQKLDVEIVTEQGLDSYETFKNMGEDVFDLLDFERQARKNALKIMNMSVKLVEDIHEGRVEGREGLTGLSLIELRNAQAVVKMAVEIVNFESPHSISRIIDDDRYNSVSALVDAEKELELQGLPLPKFDEL